MWCKWLGVLMITMTSAVHAADNQTTPMIGTVSSSIDGSPVDLGIYAGKVVMVVNVASRCGYTKQYKQLQEIFTKYESRGLVILGFPCNQFGAQEPGTESEIAAFCEKRFGVTFPMFAKIEVNGENAAPLYKYLTSDRTPIRDQGPVKWNFEKFLIDRDGKLIGRYRSKVAPDDATVIAAVEKALGVASSE